MRISDWSSDVCSSDLVEAGFPQITVLPDPSVQLSARFGSQRVEALLPVRPHPNEPGLVQDAKVPGHARLKIGRAAGGGRVSRYASVSVGAGALKKKIIH